MTNVVSSARSRLIASIHTAVGLLAISTATVAAEESDTVQLDAKDGSMSITGTLISFEDDVYVIESTLYGTMNIKAVRFECTGASCPEQAS